MRDATIRLSRRVRRHRWIVIACWVVLVGFSVPFALHDSDNLTAGFSGVDGSQSQTVQNALDAGDFGTAGDPQVGVVVEPGSDATTADVEDAVDRIDDAVKNTDDTTLTSQNLETAEKDAQSGQPFVVPIRIDSTLSGSVEIAQDLIEELDAGETKDRVTLYVVGQSSLQAEQIDQADAGAKRASTVSLAVILILLLAAFGALVAAVVPLVFGFCAVVVTGMAIYFLSQTIAISIFATSLSEMIGLAVAVDYSLFILMRYREELAAGATREKAMETAMSTSLIAVIFSGTTVIVSLAGIFLMPNSTVQTMALGAIIVVAVALLGAATLLPAAFTVLGRSVEQPAWIGRKLTAITSAARRGNPGLTFWGRQTARSVRLPWLTVTAVLIVLLVLAYPVLRMDLDESSLLQLPKDNQARVGTNLAGQIAGAGSTGPVLILVQFDSGTISDEGNQQALADVKTVVSGESEVAAVTGPQPSADDRSALYSAQLNVYPESDKAKSAVTTMRDQLADSSAAATTTISVGGLTASEVDFHNSIADTMWEIVVFILGTSFLILFVLLRSLILPIVGVAMNVLCVGTAYGVLVAIFQWGWLGFLGLQDFGFVNSVILPLLLAVVFGLSMDYQVFLLTRVRERYVHGEPTAQAVLAGTSAAARTVTAAATIMIGVFVVFVIFGVPTIQAAGLGAAVAVAASALLVQLAFMPALMVMLGDRVWWLPRWLNRMLPRIELE